jgi:hypothetical protein
MPIKPVAIFCLILIFAFIQFAEGKSASATNRLDKIPVNFRADDKEKSVIDRTRRIVEEIVNASFPELKNASITVKTFDSRADFFRARFSFARFLTFRKLHYLIFVNSQVFKKNAPVNGIRAIIAHELAHVAYYRRHNRFELFGLMGLESKSFTARFERGADLQAIMRGYGAGLKDYREWLYQNIPAKQITAKRRDYFSPAEIKLILEAIKNKPELIDFWIKNVPRNLNEIQSAIKDKN